MDYRYQGIILAKFDVGEVDRIYTIYTRESGRLRLMGKGVRRPNAKLAGNLEPLTYTEIMAARSRGMGNITGAISLNSFLALKSNLLALERAFLVFRIFGKIITEQEKDEKTFDLFLGYLEAMEKSIVHGSGEDKLDILSFGFLFKALGLAGYQLEMERCASCKEKLFPGGNFFSAVSGGILCSNCAKRDRQSIRASDGAVKLARVISKNKIENFSKIEASKRDIHNLKAIISEEANWVIG